MNWIGEDGTGLGMYRVVWYAPEGSLAKFRACLIYTTKTFWNEIFWHIIQDTRKQQNGPWEDPMRPYKHMYRYSLGRYRNIDVDRCRYVKLIRLTENAYKSMIPGSWHNLTLKNTKFSHFVIFMFLTWKIFTLKIYVFF